MQSISGRKAHVHGFAGSFSVVNKPALEVVRQLGVQIYIFADFDAIVALPGRVFCVADHLAAVSGHELSFFHVFHQE